MTILPVKLQNMKKIALGLSIFFIYITFQNFSLGVSEFCHQINFDGTELFARPDTLSYSFIAFEHRSFLLAIHVCLFSAAVYQVCGS